LSLTETVMFLMGSPSGGTKRFPGLPSIYDCPRMEGNYLQNLAARLVGKWETDGRGSWAPKSGFSDLGHPILVVGPGPPAKDGGLGFIVSHISKSRCGPPNFIGQMWATRQRCFYPRRALTAAANSLSRV
jgi:hypothetical protein